jgi:hypothetical protein
MRKLPVGRSILFAYRFVFARILDIIRVSWISVIVSITAGALLREYFASQEANLQAGNLAAAANYVTLLIAVMLIILFFNGIAAVGITREALGLGTGRGLYFPLGRTEWRMFGANIRYMIGVFALFFLAGAVGLLAYTLAGIDPQAPLAGQDVGLAGLLALSIAVAMVLYASVSMLRMGFFLPAVITAETSGGVRRAHELTKHNFWRVVLVALAVGGPVVLLFGVRNELVRGATGAFTTSMNFFFNGVMTVLFWGLWCSAAAYAYRSLADDAAGAARRDASPPQ